jgi:hypothetical protein
MLESWGGRINFKIMHEFRKPGALEATVTPIDEFEIDVIRPLVVLLNWDGVPQRVQPGVGGDANGFWFHYLLDNMSLLGGNSLVGTSAINNGVELKEMYSSFPSSTFPSHATIYTGDLPGTHGLVSNNMQDRGIPDYKNFTSIDFDPGEYLALKPNLLMHYDHPGPLDLYLMDKKIISVFPKKEYGPLGKSGKAYTEADTFYGRLNKDHEVIIAGHSFKLGVPKDNYLPGELTDGWHADMITLDKATDYIASGKHTDLMSIYIWQPDHAAHNFGLDGQTGMNAQKSYMTGMYENGTGLYGGFKEFWKAIRDNKLVKNTLFIIFDDHGRIEVDEFQMFDLRKGTYALLFDPYSHNTSFRLGENGVMTHIFLAGVTESNWNWSSQPTWSQVETIANRIATDASNILQGQIKYVLATNHHSAGPDTCRNTYCLVEPGPVVTPVAGSSLATEIRLGKLVVERINGLAAGPSANSGNIIIILESQGNSGSSPGYQFRKDPSPPPPLPQLPGNETVHGSLSRYESNVVFVMFAPVMTASDSKQSKIHDFFEQRYGSGYSTKEMLTTEIGSIVEEVVKHPEKIFMP